MGLFLSHSPPHVFETSLSLNLELTNSVRLTGQWTPGAHLPLSGCSALGLQVHTTVPAFMGLLGIQTQNLVFVWETLHQRSVSPTPLPPFLSIFLGSH